MYKSSVQSKKLINKKRVSTQLDTDTNDDWKKNKQALKMITDRGDSIENVTKDENSPILGDRNSQLFGNLVEFSHSLQMYVPITNAANYALLDMMNDLHLHKNSIDVKRRNISTESNKQHKENIGENQNAKEDAMDQDDGGTQFDNNTQKMRIINQFDFCDRSAQTAKLSKRNTETQTVPPLKGNYSANVSQWVIHDEYEKDFEAQQKNKEKKVQQIKRNVSMKNGDKSSDDSQIKNELGKWKILERMINQNIFSDITYDFKYWEDPSDQYKLTEGTLLPLWKFSCDETKKIAITYLIWFTQYPDLIAACYGSLNLMSPCSQGYLCLYSLKNPSYPENVIKTNSGVMCVDIHAEKPHFIALGLASGNLMVYNMQLSTTEPQYENSLVATQHSNIIWDIKWGPDLKDGEMNLYTASADGKVNNWILMETELIATIVTELVIDNEPIIGINQTQFARKHSITCIAFHPEEVTNYLVGTEEGLIYKCNTEYFSLIFQKYEAHHMAVYRIDYNPFNYNIFVSCSADWKIKIWEDNRLEPLFVFDLGTCIGDVKWAPYSSTVFAATTYCGKVYVYDLHINKYDPLCIQAIVPPKKSTLTRLAFNSKHPILVVGDDRGGITSLKLSPNLRQMCKIQKKDGHLDQRSLQIMKLEKILTNVREFSDFSKCKNDT